MSPACFAPVAPNWQPRAGFAGTYDDNWQQTRAPYLPDDYNPRFMNVAPPDLIYPGYLQGGEAVRVIGMHPAGDLGFALPYVNLSNKVLRKRRPNHTLHASGIVNFLQHFQTLPTVICLPGI
jgi:hypothetical protein